MTFMAAILFVSSDLMFTSRVTGAAQSLGLSMSLVSASALLPEKITADCRLALIDLSLEGLNLPSVVRAIKAGAPAARIIAYGAHVDEAALADAADAGCDLVLTRGQFHKQYADLLRGAMAGS
jgi:DNA-binding NarL/FixJ family response regulator